MEYDSILNQIGGFGKYQKVFLVVISVSSVFNSMTSFVLNFAFGEHAHRCKIPGHVDTYSPPGQVYFNTTDGIESYNVTECRIEVNGTYSKCNSWVYDDSLFTATIISKFDVVCDAKLNRAHLLLAHYLGLAVGSIAGGVLSDMIGRKPVLAIGILILVISMGLRPVVPTFLLVSMLEFLNGCGTMISYISPFIIVTEMVAPSKRLLASFICYFTFAFGNYVLLLLAYLIRDWKILFWAITGSIVSYTVALFFISESPRWLLSRGRNKEAVAILNRMAVVNGRTVQLNSEDIVIKEHHTLTFIQSVRTMIKSKRLMVRLAVVSFDWFALILTYYGISMNVAKFSGDVFVNFAASSTAEVAAITFCWIVTDRLGRKKLFVGAMILSGIACICTIFTELYAGKSLELLTTTIAMIGKFFNSITLFVVYIYTIELFPTVLRATSLGLSSMAGRIGSISSAYIGELGVVITTKFGIALPLMIFGSVALVGGIISLTLPETTDTILPESVEYAEDLTNKGRRVDIGTSHELESLTEKANGI